MVKICFVLLHIKFTTLPSLEKKMHHFKAWTWVIRPKKRNKIHSYGNIDLTHSWNKFAKCCNEGSLTQRSFQLKKKTERIIFKNKTYPWVKSNLMIKRVVCTSAKIFSIDDFEYIYNHIGEVQIKNWIWKQSFTVMNTLIMQWWK